MVVTNAISLNMLPADVAGGAIVFLRVTAEDARRLAASGGPVVSAIGHADTARIVGQQLGVELPADRRNVVLGGEPVLIAQYIGPRLPEGATELPAGARIDFFVVALGPMQQVYKVVYEEADGRLTSVATGGELEVEYVPHRWAEAPVGGLLVFTSYEAAKKFCPEGQIWQADAEDPVPLPPRGLVCATSEASACLIWEGRTTGALRWPEGTAAFRRVRIHTRIT